MPTLRFVIDSRGAETGGRQVQGSLRGVQTTARQTGRETEQLQRQLDALGLAGTRAKAGLTGVGGAGGLAGSIGPSATAIKSLNAGLVGAGAAAAAADTNVTKLGRSAAVSFPLIRSLFVGTGVVLATQRLIRYSDEYTRLRNRIKVASDTNAEFEQSTRAVFDIARDTRTAVGGTAELYARLALSTKDLNVSNEVLLGVTENVNQAIRIGGATAQEANAAMIQLSQGIASGALRGDELRSVMEQLPVVAQVLADSLGITRGELREMGHAGLITTEIIIEAFQKADADLERRFQQRITTIGESMTNFGTNTRQTIGELNDQIGASSAIAQSILFLSDHIETLGFIALVTGSRMAVAFGASQAARLRALSSFILSWPTALTVAGAAVVAFLPSIQKWLDGMRGITEETRKLQALGQDLSERLGSIPALRSVANEAENAEKRLSALRQAMRQVEEAREQIIQVQSQGQDFVEIPDAIQGSNAGARLAEQIVGGIVDELGSDASASAYRQALERFFKLSPEVAAGAFRDATTLREARAEAADAAIQAALDDAREAGRQISFTDLVLALRVELEKAPLDLVEAQLDRIDERLTADVDRDTVAAKAAEDFDRLTRSLQSDDGALNFLKSLTTEFENLGKSAEAIAVAEARAEAFKRALADGFPLLDLNGPDAFQLADEAEARVRGTFSERADISLDEQLQALRDENELLAANDAARNRLVATQIVEQAIRSEGLENIKAEVAARADVVEAITDELDRQDDLNEARQQAETADSQRIRTIEQLARAIAAAETRLREFRGDISDEEIIREQFGLGENVLGPDLQAMVDQLVDLRQKLRDPMRQIGAQLGSDLVDPIRQALLSGDFSDIGRTMGQRIATTLLEGFLLSPLEEGLQGFFQNLLSDLFSDGDEFDLGKVISDFLSGLFKVSPSAQGNVFGPTGIQEFALGGIPRSTTTSTAQSAMFQMRLQQFANGGLPGLGDLPDVGSNPAFFQIPGGGVGSIREQGLLEAIINLKNPGLPDGIRVVGTDVVLGLARDQGGKLGATLGPRALEQIMQATAPREFRFGGVPREDFRFLGVSPFGAAPSPVAPATIPSIDGVQATAASRELNDLRGSVRGLRKEFRRTRSDHVTRNRANTFSQERQGQGATAGWDNAPGRL